MPPSVALPLPTAPEACALEVLDDPVELQRYTRWTQGIQGEREGVSSLLLSGMHCASCAGTIEQAWRAVDGVLDVQVNAAAQRAQVRWDPRRTRISSLVATLRAAGYDAVPDDAASARGLRQRERRAALWRLFVAVFCGMQVMMLAAPAYFAQPGDLPADQRQLLNWGAWVLTLPVMLFAAGPFFSAAWRGLRRRRIVMELPVALGLAVSFVASTAASFQPGGLFGSEVYFDSLTMFISFLLGARWLEMTVRHRAAEALESSVAGLPETAERLLPDGRMETISARRLQPGDRVRVALGAAFPADGRLEAGQTDADESLLTGESRPVTKRGGDALVGGSINLGAPVQMRVERVGPDTRLEAIVAMVREAMSQRPAMTRQADAWAAPFLWGVLLLAAAGAAAWSVLDPTRAVWVAVSVLIVTCPCALSLAAPSALVAAAGAMARRGVVLQRLDAIEPLARMGRLYLDKTGTLTEELPRLARACQVVGRTLAAWKPGAGAAAGSSTGKVPPDLPLRIRTPEGIQETWERPGVALANGDTSASAPGDEAQVASALALAGWSRHPLSRALAQAAELIGPQARVLPDTVWQEVQEHPGLGLSALDGQGRLWRLGAAQWVGQGSDHEPPQAAPAHERPCIWFGPEGQATWCFEFEERLRPDAAAALQALRADGVALGLLSGDGAAQALALGSRLGIAEVVGGATPEGKLQVLAAAQARGETVGMVGDGVNDAPVLARADVSLAMGQGALVARAHADAVVASGRLQDIAWARQLAQRTLRVIRQNFAWAALYNLACVPLALAGWLPPWAAGLGMAASSLLVVGNALRLAR